MRTNNIDEVFAYHSEVIDLLRSNVVVPLPEFVSEHLTRHPDQRVDIEAAYGDWLNTVRKWIDNPANPVLSYHFLDGHPAFWTLETLHDGQGPVFKTTGQASHFWKGIGRSDGKEVYMMEHGAAVPPERTSHYHDHYLDSYSSSWEGCYVDTARYTFALFAITGVDSEDTRQLFYSDTDDDTDGQE